MGLLLDMGLDDDPNALAELVRLREKLRPLVRRGRRRLVGAGRLGHTQAIPRTVAAPSAIQKGEGGEGSNLPERPGRGAVEGSSELRVAHLGK
eukprot:7732326-Alexandrium_andersonii.AAC.1